MKNLDYKKMQFDMNILLPFLIGFVVFYFLCKKHVEKYVAPRLCDLVNETLSDSISLAVKNNKQTGEMCRAAINHLKKGEPLVIPELGVGNADMAPCVNCACSGGHVINTCDTRCVQALANLKNKSLKNKVFYKSDIMQLAQCVNSKCGNCRNVAKKVLRKHVTKQNIEMINTGISKGHEELVGGSSAVPMSVRKENAR